MLKDKTDFLVIGGGPAGYNGAFRAADLGLSVTIVEKLGTLGGACLNFGCIPLKTLLRTTKETQKSTLSGTDREKYIFRLNEEKERAHTSLTRGLAFLARKKGITIINGEASFISHDEIKIDCRPGTKHLTFNHALLACGSYDYHSVRKPLWTIPDALTLSEIPSTLGIIGGGVTGLELAVLYSRLGTRVSLYEEEELILPLLDSDARKWVLSDLKKAGIDIKTGRHADEMVLAAEFSKVLNTVPPLRALYTLNAEAAGIRCDTKGTPITDSGLLTTNPRVYAAGDVLFENRNAHNAEIKGVFAAEKAAGIKNSIPEREIPMEVLFLENTVIQTGLSEEQCRKFYGDALSGIFPWMANGRNHTLGGSEGYTKLIFHPETSTLVGAAVIGTGAEELATTLALAIKQRATLDDLKVLPVYHPSLSETIRSCARMISKCGTDI
jgi:dihydrolipoamide dehydrogenase